MAALAPGAALSKRGAGARRLEQLASTNTAVTTRAVRILGCRVAAAGSAVPREDNMVSRRNAASSPPMLTRGVGGPRWRCRRAHAARSLRERADALVGIALYAASSAAGRTEHGLRHDARGNAAPGNPVATQ